MTDLGERMQLRPGRALAEGMAHMFDFMGVLSHQRPNRSVEEDMALSWHEVLSVMRPPPCGGPFSLGSENSAAARVPRPVGR
jgi:hypothetical protein